MPHNRASSLSQRPQRVSSTPQGTFVNHQTFSLESRRADKGKSQIIRTSTHEVSFVLANSRPIALQKKHRFSLHYRKLPLHCRKTRISLFHFPFLFISFFFIFRFHFYLFIVWRTPSSVLRRALAHFFPFLFSWRILIHFFLLFFNFQSEF